MFAQGAGNPFSVVFYSRFVIQSAFLDVVGEALLAKRVEAGQRFWFLEELAAKRAGELVSKLGQRVFGGGHL